MDNSWIKIKEGELLFTFFLINVAVFLFLLIIYWAIK